MKILIADDEPTTRAVLKALLGRWNWEVVEATDGAAAIAALTAADRPPIAILDWLMPAADGLEVCRQVRRQPTLVPPYLLLLTALNEKADIIAGLEAGADDYMTKPFHAEELRARLAAGIRVVDLQRTLVDRVADLEQSMLGQKELRALLPICPVCRQAHQEDQYHSRLDRYIRRHSSAELASSMCPACFDSVGKPAVAAVWQAVQAE